MGRRATPSVLFVLQPPLGTPPVPMPTREGSIYDLHYRRPSRRFSLRRLALSVWGLTLIVSADLGRPSSLGRPTLHRESFSHGSPRHVATAPKQPLR
jgi:hypothetical protein